MNVTSATLLAMSMSRKGRELLRLALPFVHAEIHRLSQVFIWPYQILPSLLSVLLRDYLSQTWPLKPTPDLNYNLRQCFCKQDPRKLKQQQKAFM